MCRVVTEIHGNRLRGPIGAVAAAAIEVMAAAAAARWPTHMERLLQRLQVLSTLDWNAHPATGMHLSLLKPLMRQLCCARDPGSNQNYRRPVITFAPLAHIRRILISCLAQRIENNRRFAPR